MLIRLSASNAAPLTLEVPDDRLVSVCQPLRAALQGIREAVVAALARPVGYPPLNQAILPGDHVTISVDPELPQVREVVVELVNELLRTGRSPAEMTVLLASEEQRRLLVDALAAEVQVVVHDPEDEATHTYLAATREGQPLYLNRAIGDADVFIPLGVQLLDDNLDGRGVHGGWFPAFANLATQLRHQSPGNIEWQAHRRRRREEIEEAAWLLGVRLVVQVLPGADETIAAVWCGDADEVARTAGRACRELWLREIERPAELVIATLDGEPSWRQVARALQMASRAVVDGGAIVLWTSLSADPGPAMKSLDQSEVSDDELRLWLLKQRSADATAAKIFADCRERCRVYLHSQLDDSVVEDIGLAPLRDAGQVQRLINQAASCLVLGSAQYAGVHVKQPVEAS